MDPIFEDGRWTDYGLFREAARAVEAALISETPAELVDDEVASVLLQLARTPGERLRMVDIARSMALPPSRVTRLIDRCAAHGYVERIPCSEDRRSMWAALTVAGRRAITKAAPRMLASLDQFYFDHLTGEESHHLADVSRRLRDSIHSTALPGPGSEPPS